MTRRSLEPAAWAAAGLVGVVALAAVALGERRLAGAAGIVAWALAGVGVAARFLPERSRPTSVGARVAGALMWTAIAVAAASVPLAFATGAAEGSESPLLYFPIFVGAGLVATIAGVLRALLRGRDLTEGPRVTEEPTPTSATRRR